MVAFAIGTPLYYLGVRAWGITGAAIISTILYALVLTLGLGIYTRLTGVALRRLVPGKRDVGEARSLVIELWRKARPRAGSADSLEA
jgi:hypothetical protein